MTVSSSARELGARERAAPAYRRCRRLRARCPRRPRLSPVTLCDDVAAPAPAAPATEPLLAKRGARGAEGDAERGRQVRERRRLPAKDSVSDALHPGADEEEEDKGPRAGADEGTERSKGKRKGKGGAAAADLSLWSAPYAPPKPTRGRPTFDGG